MSQTREPEAGSGPSNAEPAAGPLAGLRVVESTAFVAAPSCGLTLAQLGAEVIRVDPPGGGLDYRRWPHAPGTGQSLYWTSLNKAKKSAVIDLRKPEGRQLVADLVAAPGEGGGIFVTNLPARGPLAFEALRAARPDVIMVSLSGSPDGATAIDYTANASAGIASITGRGAATGPVNNALPAWDVIAGLTLALGILAAERHRRATGQGQFIELSLTDVAMATVANLGMLAEAELNAEPRRAEGNWIYGAFGRDFETGDGRRIMLAAVTDKQWQAIVEAMDLAEPMGHLERAFGVDFSREEGRVRAREAIAVLIEDWTRARSLAEIEAAFAGRGLCWSPFRDFKQMLAEDARCSPDNFMFARLAHPGVPPVLTPHSPLRFSGGARAGARPARPLGADTASVLADLLDADEARLAALAEAGLIAAPEPSERDAAPGSLERGRPAQ